MNLYKSLARVYHQMYQNLFDYDAEFSFYANQLKTHHIKNLIEFGCGTGNLASRFLNNGFEYHGVDLNEEMLEIAKETMPAEFFTPSDIGSFSTNKKYEAALLTGRTISYLTKNKHIIDSFKAIHYCLSDGGILIFDAIDAKQMFANFDFETKILNTNGYQRISHSALNLDSGWTWNWYADYYKIQESEKQLVGNDEAILRAFTPDELSIFLSLTGFELVEIIKKETYTWEDNYFIARKNEN